MITIPTVSWLLFVVAAFVLGMATRTSIDRRRAKRRVVRTWDAKSARKFPNAFQRDVDRCIATRELEHKLGRPKPQPTTYRVEASTVNGAMCAPGIPRAGTKHPNGWECYGIEAAEIIPGVFEVVASWQPPGSAPLSPTEEEKKTQAAKPQPPPNLDCTEGRTAESERCQRCGGHGSDRRNLWISCLSNLMESSIPFTEQFFAQNPTGPRRLYMLRICKDCRAEFIATIERWHASGLSSREANIKL